MTKGAVVTKKQLLKKLGLTQPELDDLLVKFGDFQKLLSPKQTKVVNRSLPTLSETAAWLGPHATEADLRKLFGGGGGRGAGSPPIMVCHFATTDRP
jgi:hypothetical protein